jgi:CRISPR/Cas system-associated exonuclease Cas4 (RecB family)
MFNLIEATDAFTCRKKVHLPRLHSLYPSEASVVYPVPGGSMKTEGKCLRSVYYRIIGEEVPTQADPYSEWIFATGKGVENILIEYWKCMGIWVDNNVKFFDAKRNISGEIDVILSEPDGTLFGVECKSFAGYSATKEVIGNFHQPGKPKTSQLLQTLIYVDLCRELGIIDYFKMIYYARDSGQRREYNISLTEDGGQWRPTIDGIIDYRFTMQDVYDRYALLNDYVENKILPPRDYELVYSDEKIEGLNKLGEIAKTKYDKCKNNHEKNPIGDWECRYCNYCKVCWQKSATTTEIMEEID